MYNLKSNKRLRANIHEKTHEKSQNHRLYPHFNGHKQDNDNQKLEIYEYARKQGMTVDEVLEIQISSRKSRLQRRIDELIEKLNEGDTLIVTESHLTLRALPQGGKFNQARSMKGHSAIGHISFDMKKLGKRSLGNPDAAFEEEGDGNVIERCARHRSTLL